MKVRDWAAAAAAFGLAGAVGVATAHADASAKPPVASCFFTRNWEGWHSPDPNTIYLRVSLKDIYKVDLSSGSPLLTWPDSHLVNRVRGTDSVCGPLDLDLTVSDGTGIREPLFIKAITKLTAAQVAAIPKKDLP